MAGGHTTVCKESRELPPARGGAVRSPDYIAPASFYQGREWRLPGPAHLDIAGFRKAIPEAPIYGYVDRPPQASNASDWAAHFRQETQRAIAAGAAGIGLFNFFTCRSKFEPPFATLKNLLDSLAACKRKASPLHY